MKLISSILKDKSVNEKILSSDSWLWLSKVSKKFNLNTSQLLFSQKYRLLGLLQRQDRATMAHGVESRAPFLKPSFVSWVNSVPMTYKYNRNMKTNKLVLRKYMANYLHPNIISREKIGFGSDFDHEYKMKEFQKKN